jgi:hypothetical protein
MLYVKTALGLTELKSRAAGLSPRLRSLLVMIDGSRPAEQLLALSSGIGGAAALDELLRGGFIEPAATPAPAEGPAPVPAPATPAAAGDPSKVGAGKMVLRRYAKLAASVADARALNKRIDTVHTLPDAVACAEAVAAHLQAADNADAAALLRAELRASLG